MRSAYFMLRDSTTSCSGNAPNNPRQINCQSLGRSECHREQWPLSSSCLTQLQENASIARNSMAARVAWHLQAPPNWTKILKNKINKTSLSGQILAFSDSHALRACCGLLVWSRVWRSVHWEHAAEYWFRAESGDLFNWVPALSAIARVGSQIREVLPSHDDSCTNGRAGLAGCLRLASNGTNRWKQ